MGRRVRSPLPLATTFARGISTAAGMQSLVNLFAEPIRHEGRTQIVLYPMPGRTLFSSTGAKCRGQVDVGETNYSVNGTRLYQIAADGTKLDLGEIEGDALVDMDYNGTQLVIVAELKSYVLDTMLVLSEITDPDFIHPNSVASLGQISVFTRAATGEFDWATLADATSYDALDFATADTNADSNVCVRSAHGALKFFGTRTIEPWYYSGNAAQAFTRQSLASVEIGNLSRDATLLVDNEFMFVGRDGKSGGAGVYRTKGAGAVKVSPPGVDRYLEEYGDLSLCHAVPFQVLGHSFYSLTLPGLVTVAMDLATSQWIYQRSGTYPMNAEPEGGWDAVTFSTNGQNRIIGASDGNLYKLDHTVYDDDGEIIVREVVCPQLSLGGGQRGTLWRLGLDMEMGATELATGQGSDPKVMMCFSKDGGRTWSTPREASIGQVGQYKILATWNNLGDFENIIIKFRVTDPVKTVFLGAWYEAELHG